MSWIVGMIGNAIPEIEQKAMLSRYEYSGKTIGEPGTFLAIAGGNPDTLFSYSDDSFSLLVAGIGILRAASSASILTVHDWVKRLTPDIPDIADLDGHFIIIRYRNGILDCFSDKVGLRTLYAARTHFGWTFGTQLEAVCALLPSASIDWNTFGSRWLCLQQCSHESPVRGIRKLPPNGAFRITAEAIDVSALPWLSYSSPAATPAHAVELLRSLLTVHDATVTLGLSGGLDSRVLLSLLASSGQPYSAYAFGGSDDPDVALAGKICRSEGIRFRHIEESFPSAGHCLSMMQEYIQRTHLVEGAASSVRLRYYSALRQPNSIMIDGGNGEILRRQFLRRISFFAQDDLMHRRTERLLPLFLLRRADIFNSEITATMHEGAAADLDRSLQSLPSPQVIGEENFLDAWTITTRIPIVACDEQARIDESTINFMPFSQPSVLQCAIMLPLTERRNNRFSKNIIRTYSPSLSRFPLIKNGIAYPYWLTTLQSRIWTAVRSRLDRRDRDADLRFFLNSVKEYALDIVHSNGTRNYSPYQYDKVFKIVTGYYNGNKQYARELNWWLAFDVWRRAVEK
ncbi:MAG: asparagine synthase (glutamine-hydrolyzing) [Bacteroidota bacterium]